MDVILIHAPPTRTTSARSARTYAALSAGLLIAGAASACAPSSRIDVVHTGLTATSAPHAYVMDATADPMTNNFKAAQAVERQFARLGWTAVTTTTDWKVETAYVVRANSVGAVDRAGEDEKWLVQPERRPWWRRQSSIHALSVRLVRPATGEELSRSTAHLHLIGGMTDSLMDSLAAAAVNQMVVGATVPTS